MNEIYTLSMVVSKGQSLGTDHSPVLGPAVSAKQRSS